MSNNKKILQILHRSKNFICVNKPFDVVVNDNDLERESVMNLLKDQCPGTSNPKLFHGYYVCHRLDYSTSGIFVVPLTKTATKQACKAFENSKVLKHYLAIVRGHCQENFYKINLPIGEDCRPEFKKLRVAIQGSEHCQNARQAETLVAVLSRGFYKDQPVTKVLLRPLTGRRHQLRVHCDSIGHTILGDYTYSNKQDIEPYRMYLHAFKISLPTALETIDITTEDPFENVDEYKPTEIVNDYSNLNEIFMGS